MTPEQIASIASNFVVGGVFIMAWFQERKERQDQASKYQERLDLLNARLYELVKETIVYRATAHYDTSVRDKKTEQEL
ncbi:MAG TPA: hypothetical protein PLD47_05650 [Aggregatilineales bacterium]|nr:hypothetical protein [Anaerolineales bacterium]HRE47191.1 hypothetical protein [Aggregatilineales bacterium]